MDKTGNLLEIICGSIAYGIPLSDSPSYTYVVDTRVPLKSHGTVVLAAVAQKGVPSTHIPISYS